MNKKDIISIARTAIDAGQEILRVYDTLEFGVEFKKDNSPLTIADIKSHLIIKENLSLLEIDGVILPLLSEEGKSITYEERKNWKRYWLIDPLDGTKEFIKKNGEFTVNIALIENGVPFAGFVYIPVHDILYFGSDGLGSFRLENASECSGNSIIDSSKKLSIDENIVSPIKVVASRSHMSAETEDYIQRLRNSFGEIEIISSGSSIKLCMVADGRAHVYPRFAPTMEWDTAAAHAVCRYAGVKVIDYKTKGELKYNKKSLLNNWFLVSGNEKFEEI